MATDEEKQRIREATDLVSLVGETVQLRSRGRDFWGPCPFHPEKTPSFHVIPDRGFWKCFSCGKGGDCFTFIMERDHVEFGEAVQILADRAGIEIERSSRSTGSKSPKARLYDVLTETVSFYHRRLLCDPSSGASAARAYLGGRGFGSGVSKRWQLGFAPGDGQLVRHLNTKGFSPTEMIDANVAVRGKGNQVQDRFFNRVMFPIFDERGRAIGLGGRVLDDSKPKYLNTSETPIFHKGSTLFALNLAKASITAQACAVVMEGYTDVISSHEAGITNVVAPLGTAFRARHVKILSRYLTNPGEHYSSGRIIFIFDGDEAGMKAAERALQFVGQTTTPFYCVVLPGGQDPAEFIGAQGADAMRQLLEQPRRLSEFVVEHRLARHDTTRAEERSYALRDVVEAIAPLRGTAEADECIDRVAAALQLDPSTVRTALGQVKWVPPRDDDDGDSYDAGAMQTRLDLRDDDRPPYDDADAFAYDEPPADDVAIPGAPAARPVELLESDRIMLAKERDLLCLLYSNLELAQEQAGRLVQMNWTDPAHEAILWGILSAPVDMPPLKVLGLLQSTVPNASEVLACGIRTTENANDPRKALKLMLDDIERAQIDRQITAGRARLRIIGGADEAGLAEVLEQLKDLQRRRVELDESIRTNT